MRKCLVIVMALLFFVALPVHANEISVFLDDERVILEHYPTVENGQMLIPVLDISRAMGHPSELLETGDWLVYIGDTIIRFRPESNQISIDGKRYTMDREPFMLNGNPYLPLGILQKATGFELYFDIAQNAVFVKGPKTYTVPGAIRVFASQAGHMFFVGTNQKIGLADERGNIIVAPEWDEVLPAIREGIVVFRVGDKWGMMHTEKGSIYRPQWERIQHYVNKIAIAYRKGSSYAMDLNGDIIVGGQSDDIVIAGSNMLFTRAMDDSKKGVEVVFYNTKGRQIQTIKDEHGGVIKERVYTDADVWNHNIARVKNGVTNEFGLVNYMGVEILSCSYQEVGDLGPDGYAVIKKKDDDGILREGIVGSNGIRVAKAEYRKVHLPYSNGLCLVEKYGRYGYIDTKGKVVLDFQFDEAYPFVDGKAIVLGFVNGRGKKQYYYIDNKGNYVGVPKLGADGRPVLDVPSLDRYAGKNLIFESSKRFGVRNQTGELIWPAVWDELLPLSSEHFAVRKENKWGLIDKFGRLLAPVKYVSMEREPGRKDVFKAVIQELRNDKKTGKKTPEKAVWLDFNGRILFETGIHENRAKEK